MVLSPVLGCTCRALNFDANSRISDILPEQWYLCRDTSTIGSQARLIINKGKLSPLNTCVLVAIGGTTRQSRTTPAPYPPSWSRARTNAPRQKMGGLPQKRTDAAASVTRRTTRHVSDSN